MRHLLHGDVTRVRQCAVTLAALPRLDPEIGADARHDAGMVGNLDNVSNIDIQYAHSAILTPCDFPFARDGIAAEASENVEMIIVADLNTGTLLESRAAGTVRPLRDRRTDLYRTRGVDGG